MRLTFDEPHHVLMRHGNLRRDSQGHMMHMPRSIFETDLAYCMILASHGLTLPSALEAR
jgi:hypothetical protein